MVEIHLVFLLKPLHTSLYSNSTL